MDRLITILRRPAGLFALINRPKCVFRMWSYYEHKNNSADELNDFYEVIESPLDAVSSDVAPSKSRLLESWKALASIRKLDGTALLHCLVVLLDSQLDLQAPHHEPPPLQQPLEAPGPTACHPRGFRETRIQRSKLASRFVDLRPHLCERKNQRTLLEMLAPFSSEAFSELIRFKYSPSSLDQIHILGESRDLYFDYHYGLKESPPKLPSAFVRMILPALRGSPWSIVTKFISIYWGLSLNESPKLLTAINRLISFGNAESILAWCNVLERQPRNRRCIFATTLIETGTYNIDPQKLKEGVFDELAACTTRSRYPKRLYHLLNALMNGVSPHYALIGFRLANRYPGSEEFLQDCAPHSFFNHGEMEKMIHLFMQRSRPELALYVWMSCAELKDLDHVLAQFEWKSLAKEAMDRLLRFYGGFAIRDLSEQKEKELWAFVRGQVPAVTRLVKTTDKAYVWKLCDHLSKFHWHYNDARDLKKVISVVYRILLKTCRDPFPKKSDEVYVLCYFMKHSGWLMEAFLTAPESSFLNLAKACQSRNDVESIESGLEVMIKSNPLWAIKCFRHFPGKLLQVCKLLGSFREPDQIRIVKQYQDSLLMRRGFKKLSAVESVKVILALLTPGVCNPVPKRLQQYVHGQFELSPTRISRYRRITFEKLNLTRLEMLEQELLKFLGGPFPEEENKGNLMHALQVMHQIKDNKRSFKRFIKNYLSGNVQYAFEHPRTQEWIRKHNNLNLVLWTTGITYIGDTEKYGRVSIEMEKDPLEVLRMGTYVGSCLGLGGRYAYSAVANVLDINKQVVYARNEKGTVVGRQLLAIAETGNMVCFHVYPAGVDKEIKSLFREYDLAFAKALDVRITKKEERYSIAHVLSQNWWDDYAWNLTD